MSNIHVLEGQGNDYRAIIHIAVPVENNAVGVALRTALVNAGLNTTMMTVGSGAGQISSAEAAQIQAGEVYELMFTFSNNPAWTGPQRQAAFNQEVSNRASIALADLRRNMAYFGHSQ